ncbi:GFA family protein [Sinorhizobium fredii]|uniref:GFA family protein n=1 Tax=Rhizobium fredii TaxID=380 RepID=UPI001FCAFFEB|nr:GFA family protein [Sinorhizobium fredii]
MCRKQSGHVLAAVNVRRDALEVGGEQHVCWYRSSDKVERGFCSACGSTLFWKPTIEGYEFTAVAMGLFDGPTGLHLSNTHLWAKRATITKSQTVCRRATVTDCARFQGGCGRPGALGLLAARFLLGYLEWQPSPSMSRSGRQSEDRSCNPEPPA